METPSAGAVPSTSAGGNDNEKTLRQANLDSRDSQTWPYPDTLMPPQMVAQLEEQVTLPRHVSIEGKDTSFIKYFWEHRMTTILMHTLETKRGWTDDMITCLIQNCNKAWGLSHIAPENHSIGTRWIWMKRCILHREARNEEEMKRMTVRIAGTLTHQST